MTGQEPWRARGVLAVLPTPFDDDGRVDTASARRLAAAAAAAGADAVVCFGLAGEIHKLDDGDRDAVLEAVVEAVGGRIAVVVGTEHSGTRAAVRRTQRAKELGAAAAMAFPPSFVAPGRDDVTHYFRALADAGLPVIVQDAPAWTRVELPPDLLASLAAHPGVVAVKLEAPPIAEKAAVLRDEGLDVITGFGGMHLLEDLSAGPDGIMPGCGLLGLFVRAWRAHSEGDADTVAAIYTSALPVLVAQLTSLDTFIEVQKRLLAETGVLGSSHVRRPHRPLPEPRWRWIRELVDRQGLAGHLLRPDTIAVDTRPETLPIG